MYHCWMLSDELRQLTASEPLSLEEEFEMQKSWNFDTDSNSVFLYKLYSALILIYLIELTFIIVSNQEKDFHLNNGEVEKYGKPIGDVNIFLNDENDEHLSECEIMIAGMCQDRYQ